MHGERGQAIARNIAKVPAVFAEGFRFAISLFTHPRQGGLAVLGAAGFWAANIGILWASFHAFGVHVPLAVVVQGFFLGMVANLIPFAPAGVGAVDAGMIGAFVLFGIPEDDRLPGDPGLPPDRLLDADSRSASSPSSSSATRVQRWEDGGPADRPHAARADCRGRLTRSA